MSDVKLACPFVYANGKRCTGHVTGWKVYGGRDYRPAAQGRGSREPSVAAPHKTPPTAPGLRSAAYHSTRKTPLGLTPQSPPT